MNRCQCEAPSTRMLKVVYAKGAEKGKVPFDLHRSTHFAACEPHRHSAKRILEEKWNMEISRGEVKVLMGVRRAQGR